MRFAVCLALALAQSAEAQLPKDTIPNDHSSQYSAIRASVLNGSLSLDGRLDDEAWKDAQPVAAFRQTEPAESALPSERTEVRVLISPDAIYIGARLYDSQPAQIRARLARRDEFSGSDYFAIAIDSYHDHRTAFSFSVTPAGAIRDALISSDGSRDDSWDPRWEAKTSVDSAGWSVEAKIPLSNLHFTTSTNPVWGIQFIRLIARKQELDQFPFSPKSVAADVSRFGHLAALGSLVAPKHLELFPYVLTRVEHRAQGLVSPLAPKSSHGISGGIDIRYGLTSELTFTGTVNPDFGQVDVDPAVVNLTGFETFYPEHRPFFVEGGDVFRFGDLTAPGLGSLPKLFHSRRIGRAPQGAVEGDYVDINVPTETSILGAAKLSGRVSGWGLGFLNALTGAESAKVLDQQSREGRINVEPLTNYLVARVRHESREGATAIGGLLTGVNRHLKDQAVASLLPASAYVAGLDASHSWAERNWHADFAFYGSRLAGSESAIAGIQLNPVHRFQRPDASSFHFDPTRKSLTGIGSHLEVMKIGGAHWLGSLAYRYASPGLDPNDLGFLRRADAHLLGGSVKFKQDKPGTLFRKYALLATVLNGFDADGTKAITRQQLEFSGRFSNYWDFVVRGEYWPAYYDDRLARGGPLVKIPRGPVANIELTSDARRSYSAGVTFAYTQFHPGYYDRFYGLAFSLRPSPALQIGIEPSLINNNESYQYVSVVTDAAAISTFGKRYVFADIKQKELSLGTRVDWTFSPTLSLNLYAQPLVSAVTYHSFKELASPKSFDFKVYGSDIGWITRDNSAGEYTVDPDGPGGSPAFSFSDPAFTFRSLRGNAVVRWEYRPGSTVFFVWQQQREGSDFTGRFSPRHDGREMLRLPAHDVFVVKATYWVGA